MCTAQAAHQRGIGQVPRHQPGAPDAFGLQGSDQALKRQLHGQDLGDRERVIPALCLGCPRFCV